VDYSSVTNLADFKTNKFELLLPSLNKLVSPYPGIGNAISLTASGSGRLYFIYPRANGIGDNLNESSLLSIKDPNGLLLYQKGNPTASAFYPGTFNMSNMSNQTGLGEYVLWLSKYPCGYSDIGNFELSFTASSAFSWPTGNGIMT
jgi:hypothetical protein